MNKFKLICVAVIIFASHVIVVNAVEVKEKNNDELIVLLKEQINNQEKMIKSLNTLNKNINICIKKMNEVHNNEISFTNLDETLKKINIDGNDDPKIHTAILLKQLELQKTGLKILESLKRGVCGNDFDE